MCSWCWAFRPTLTKVIQALPQSIKVKYLVGGLAPDSTAPMVEATQMMIQRHWQTITQRVPGTAFNFDFWTLNAPLRSTYPSCRAVLAAKALDLNKEDAMVLAIQQAYYLDAQNPSVDNVLIKCAESIGLDAELFKSKLNAAEMNIALKQNIQQAQFMGVTSFPSLVLEQNDSYQHINIDYNHAEHILKQLANF